MRLWYSTSEASLPGSTPSIAHLGRSSETDAGSDPPLSAPTSTPPMAVIRPIASAPTVRRGSPALAEILASLDQSDGERRRRRRQRRDWLGAGLAILLGGIALIAIGIVEVGQLAVVGYVLFLVGAALLMHAHGVTSRATIHLRRVRHARQRASGR